MKSLPGTRGVQPANRSRSSLKAVGMTIAVLSPALLTVSCAAAKTDSSCPNVFIVQDLGAVSRYGAGGNREPANLQFQAEMRDIRGDCSVKPGAADVRMSFSIVGERGGNDRSGPEGGPLKSVDLAYFAAVTDPTNAILWKEQFTTTLVFGDNRRAATLEELDPHIPLPKNITASGYKVLLGFQLTPEEAAENRRLSGTATPPPTPPKVTATPLPPAAPPATLQPPARATPPIVRRPVPPKTVPPKTPPKATPSRALPPEASPPEAPASTTIPGTSQPSAAPAPYTGLLSPGYVAPNRPAPSGTPDASQ